MELKKKAGKERSDDAEKAMRQEIDGLQVRHLQPTSGFSWCRNKVGFRLDT